MAPQNRRRAMYRPLTPVPATRCATGQIPMEGTRLVYSFEGAKAREHHRTHHFEIAGKRAIQHDGRYARTIHHAPLGGQAAPSRRRPGIVEGTAGHTRAFDRLPRHAVDDKGCPAPSPAWPGAQ
jgi:hypothetical protein